MIDSFSGPYAFLSNLYPCDVAYCDVRFPSAEHAYLAARHKWNLKLYLSIARMSQNQLLAARDSVIDCSERWLSNRIYVMQRLIDDKFIMSQDLTAKLLKTRGRRLVYGNSGNDSFWGLGTHRNGENWLGRCLMNIRERLWRIPFNRQLAGHVEPRGITRREKFARIGRERSDLKKGE